MAVYKYTLHHSANTVPKWFLETLGVWVSILNGCDYCVDHHFAGLQRLLGDLPRGLALRAAMEARRIADGPLEGREKLAMEYARALTVAPARLTAAGAEGLRQAGWSDGDIGDQSGLRLFQLCQPHGPGAWLFDGRRYSGLVAGKFGQP